MIKSGHPHRKPSPLRRGLFLHFVMPRPCIMSLRRENQSRAEQYKTQTSTSSPEAVYRPPCTCRSHNVPPYGRAGLYKQLATLKDLIGEDREARNTAAQQRQQQASGGEAAGAAAASAASMAGAPATATAGGG
jgi:hypothetical protein